MQVCRIVMLTVEASDYIGWHIIFGTVIYDTIWRKDADLLSPCVPKFEPTATYKESVQRGSTEFFTSEVTLIFLANTNGIRIVVESLSAGKMELRSPYSL